MSEHDDVKTIRRLYAEHESFCNEEHDGCHDDYDEMECFMRWVEERLKQSEGFDG